MSGSKRGAKHWPYWAAALIGAEAALVLANVHDGVPALRLSHMDWAGIPVGPLIGEALGGALIGLFVAFLWSRLIRPRASVPPPKP